MSRVHVLSFSVAMFLLFLFFWSRSSSATRWHRFYSLS